MNKEKQQNKNNANKGFGEILKEILEIIFLVDMPFSLKVLSSFSVFYVFITLFVSFFGLSHLKEDITKSCVILLLIIMYCVSYYLLLKILIKYIENKK